MSESFDRESRRTPEPERLKIEGLDWEEEERRSFSGVESARRLAGQGEAVPDEEARPEAGAALLAYAPSSSIRTHSTRRLNSNCDETAPPALTRARRIVRARIAPSSSFALTRLRPRRRCRWPRARRTRADGPCKRWDSGLVLVAVLVPLRRIVRRWLRFEAEPHVAGDLVRFGPLAVQVAKGGPGTVDFPP